MTETLGERFYLVRLACGDGVRRPEPLRLFVERIKRETGEVIHASELSDIERNKPSKAVTVDHIKAVAAVDPKRRGLDWLVLGYEKGPAHAEPIIPPGATNVRSHPDPDAAESATSATPHPHTTRRAGGD